MKKIALAVSALALLAGAANAAGANSPERPDAVVAASGLTKVDVKAKDVAFPKELHRAGLSSDQTVSVTLFPSTGTVDRPSRD